MWCKEEEEAGGEGGGGEHTTKNKNPTQRCGGKKVGHGQKPFFLKQTREAGLMGQQAATGKSAQIVFQQVWTLEKDLHQLL